VARGRKRINYPQRCVCGDIAWQASKLAIIIVDGEDLELLEGDTWVVRYGYAYGAKSGPLHRTILNVEGERVADHVNRHRSDCRKANLRPCTPRQNSQNLGAQRRLKSPTRPQSKFKGVFWDRGKWRSKIRTEKGRLWLGTFPDEEAAALAYDAAARQHHGEFAATNF
jgi:hypothetical protein